MLSGNEAGHIHDRLELNSFAELTGAFAKLA
jgi:hypothetical protein